MTSDPSARDAQRMSSAGFWFQAALGLALAGAGVYLIVDRGGSPFGLLLMCIGAIAMPWSVLGIIGGVGLAVLGGYLVLHAGGTVDYVIGGLAALIGVSTVWDRVKALKRARSGGERPRV